jgi:magnesium transporter
MIEEPVTIAVTADRDDVAGVVARYNLLAVPVVDDDHRLVGIVTVDDAIDTILPANRRRRVTRAGTRG